MINRLTHRVFRQNGFSLLELVISILILSVISVGAMGYQVFATKMALRANAEITVAQTARMILDNWKKRGGDANFNLTSLDSGFSIAGGLDKYTITISDLPMTVQIQWDDIDVDAVAMVTLRKIETTIQWRSDYKTGAIRLGDPSYVIATYVRRDEAGG